MPAPGTGMQGETPVSTLTGTIRRSWSLAPTGLLTVNGALVAVIGESLPGRLYYHQDPAGGELRGGAPNRMVVAVQATQFHLLATRLATN